MIRRPPSSPFFPTPPLSRPPLDRSPPVKRLSVLMAVCFVDMLGLMLVAPLMAFYALRLHAPDRKSTRLNSSHSQISYAVFCLKKKKKRQQSMHRILYSTTLE